MTSVNAVWFLGKKFYQPKENGRLGFRNIEKCISSFFMKLHWQLMYEDNKLWVKIIRARYSKNQNL